MYPLAKDSRMKLNGKIPAKFMAVAAVLLVRAAQGAPVSGLSMGDSRLLATGGVTQIEGAAGGGLVPWALIAGYGSKEEVGATAFYTRADPTDFTLGSTGIAVGIRDRLELSAARQKLGLGTTVPGASIRQDILGVKLKLTGDAVFARYFDAPQISAGVQYKRNADFRPVPAALNARRDADFDYYAAATKVFLDALHGRTLLVDLTLRATRANQMGLLGFGGDKNDRRTLQAETSIALFATDHVLVGAEYRHKPDNLSAFREDSYKDIFVTWLPNKKISLTTAYADLGTIADKKHQRAIYGSVQVGF